MAQTIAFYLLVFAGALLLTRRSETTGRPFGLILATALLVLVSGFRAHSVGVDTGFYKIGTDYFFQNGEVYWRYSFAYGYGVFTSAILHVCNDYTVLLFVQAIITHGLIAARFWDFRHGASLTFMMLGYLCTAYLLTLCIICQFVAVAIVFYCSRFLDKGHPLLYLLGVAIAAQLHLSALISIVAVVPFLVKFRGISARGGASPGSRVCCPGIRLRVCVEPAYWQLLKLQHEHQGLVSGSHGIHPDIRSGRLLAPRRIFQDDDGSLWRYSRTA